MPVVTPTDVRQLQADIRGAIYPLAIAVGNCVRAGKLAASDGDAWIAFATRAEAFLAEDPSWLNTAAQMNAGEQIERDLQPWYAKLRAAGCSDIPPAPTPPPAQSDLLGSLKDVGLLVVAAILLLEFGSIGKR